MVGRVEDARLFSVFVLCYDALEVSQGGWYENADDPAPFIKYLLLVILAAYRELDEMLEAGTKAPEFTLLNKNSKTVSLSDFEGKQIVLYFYPRDNTRQACAFAGAYDEFKKLNVVVIGVSKDSVASHQKFAEKHGLPFIILSNP